jgi:hypothetical protein
MAKKTLTQAQKIEAQFMGDYTPDFVILPSDEQGDECVCCHKLAATIEDGDTGDRFCDMDCYEEYLSNQAEAAYERQVERFYGG